MAITGTRTHLLRQNAGITDGRGLGRCYNHGVVTKDESEVDCKNCIKRLKEQHAKAK